MVITSKKGAAVLSPDGTSVMAGEKGSSYFFVEVEHGGVPQEGYALSGQWLQICVTPRGFVVKNPSDGANWVLKRIFTNEQNRLDATTEPNLLRLDEAIMSVRELQGSTLERSHGHIKAFRLAGS